MQEINGEIKLDLIEEKIELDDFIGNRAYQFIFKHLGSKGVVVLAMAKVLFGDRLHLLGIDHITRKSRKRQFEKTIPVSRETGKPLP